MQPYLLPYAGYYQLLEASDVFVFLDDVAFINRGWINRNRIIVNGQAQYFTVPLSGASQNRLIREIDIVPDNSWRDKMLRTVEHAYKKAPFFDAAFSLFSRIIRYPDLNLSAWLYHSFQQVTAYLDMEKKMVASSGIYELGHLKGQDKIVSLARVENCEMYINLPSGRELYEKEVFRETGIDLRFINPQLLPYQQQGTAEFLAGLSLLDIMMNLDPSSVKNYLKNYTLE